MNLTTTDRHPSTSSPDHSSNRPARRAQRSRWAAVGAAVTIALGGGGLMSASAAQDTGERATFVPIVPCRIMDTRPAPETVGPRATPLGQGETHTIDVHGVNGKCDVPTDAVGVVLNVAAVNPTAGSFLTVFPAGGNVPLAANLNWVAGQPPVSNAVTADLSGDGRLSFYNLAGTVDVTADVVGYYVDHTHDDRYYTETEIDERLSAGTARAHTSTDGGVQMLSTRTKGFTAITRPQTGIWCLTVDPATGIDPTRSVALVSVEHGNSILRGGSAEWRASGFGCGSPSVIEVRTFDQAGDPTNLVAFTVVIP